MKRLSYNDRKDFEKMYAEGATPAAIAAALGIAQSTVYRELIRGSTGDMDENGRVGYAAIIAQKALLTRLNK